MLFSAVQYLLGTKWQRDTISNWWVEHLATNEPDISPKCWLKPKYGSADSSTWPKKDQFMCKHVVFVVQKVHTWRLECVWKKYLSEKKENVKK